MYRAARPWQSPGTRQAALWLQAFHYIDLMLVTLLTTIQVALSFNRLALGERAQFVGWKGMIPSQTA